MGKNEQETRHAVMFADAENQGHYLPRPPGRVQAKKVSAHEMIQPCVPTVDPQVLQHISHVLSLNMFQNMKEKKVRSLGLSG